MQFWPNTTRTDTIVLSHYCLFFPLLTIGATVGTPCIQGLSTGIDIFWRPWRPTINNFLVKMNISVYFWGLGIWVSSTKFWKNNIGWLQQPPSERVPYISEKLDFWWSIPWKGMIIGQFGARNDPTIRISKNFDKMRLLRSLRPLRLLRLLRSLRLQRF